MWPATAWTDDDWDGQHARGWTVTAALRARRDRKVQLALDARHRIQERAGTMREMTATSWIADAADEAVARWSGGPNVLAFLFAHPDSEAITSLDARGEYFDHRTGNTWDLFFPGYYRSPEDADFEHRVGARRAGNGHLKDWFFHPGDFNMFRRQLESYTKRRWTYSGGTDLVLASGWVSARDEPSVDWNTTISGSVTDETTGVLTLSLPEIVERISRDIEDALGSDDYGVGDVTCPPGPSDPSGGPSAHRDIFTNALGGIIAVLGSKALGAG